MSLFFEQPAFLKFEQFAVLWAIICIGVCLPLITLKLYWNSLSSLFRESPYHEFDRLRHAPPETKPGPATHH